MKISYAITVCNEAVEFKRLLDLLVANKRPEDEIVVLQDVTEPSDEVNKIFIDYADHIDCRVTSKFGRDFSAWKNELAAHCLGDYIFQIDADESLAPKFVQDLPKLLELNPDVDMYWVPRINHVEGITKEDIERWHWRIDEQGRINWPDYQGRIYRNNGKIEWKGLVHEKLVGYKTYAKLPSFYYLLHDKTIDKQRSQNEFYAKGMQK